MSAVDSGERSGSMKATALLSDSDVLVIHTPIAPWAGPYCPEEQVPKKPGRPRRPGN